MASASKGKRSEKVDKIFKKLEKSIDNGDFYEASQMTKTLYFRYKMQGRYDDAIQVLFDSAVLLIKHDQLESGLDLARLLVECYRDCKKEVSNEPLEHLVEVLHLCDRDCPTRQDFIREALQWTAKDHVYGHSKLHSTAASKYWQEKSYLPARRHIIYTTDGTTCAMFLVEYHVTRGYPGEIDLFVTQAVLQILCLKNTSTANVVFFTYTERHPGINKNLQPYKQPLLNFIAFLLIAVESGSIQQFTVLCEKYQPSLSRDPMYFEYLDKIGQVFFGLPPKKKEKNDGIMGIIGDIMEGMLGVPEGESPMDIEVAHEDVD